MEDNKTSFFDFSDEDALDHTEGKAFGIDKKRQDKMDSKQGSPKKPQETSQHKNSSERTIEGFVAEFLKINGRKPFPKELQEFKRVYQLSKPEIRIGRAELRIKKVSKLKPRPDADTDSAFYKRFKDWKPYEILASNLQRAAIKKFLPPILAFHYSLFYDQEPVSKKNDPQNDLGEQEDNKESEDLEDMPGYKKLKAVLENEYDELEIILNDDQKKSLKKVMVHKNPDRYKDLYPQIDISTDPDPEPDFSSINPHLKAPSEDSTDIKANLRYIKNFLKFKNIPQKSTKSLSSSFIEEIIKEVQEEDEQECEEEKEQSMDVDSCGREQMRDFEDTENMVIDNETYSKLHTTSPDPKPQPPSPTIPPHITAESLQQTDPYHPQISKILKKLKTLTNT
ncbi:unnamed protein product [Moneuplotes crassus]|uniref:Uncharacterized protein n=1 Tax=Euplotes crassus TaxID=5936 RepID=A0AAD1X726_EUPCR|nr:unnamed protein product [Moneuplotes crassus]